MLQHVEIIEYRFSPPNRFFNKKKFVSWLKILKKLKILVSRNSHLGLRWNFKLLLRFFNFLEIHVVWVLSCWKREKNEGHSVDLLLLDEIFRSYELSRLYQQLCRSKKASSSWRGPKYDPREKKTDSSVKFNNIVFKKKLLIFFNK